MYNDWVFYFLLHLLHEKNIAILKTVIPPVSFNLLTLKLKKKNYGNVIATQTKLLSDNQIKDVFDIPVHVVV